MYGRFNEFEGTFTHDQDDPSKNRVTVTIDTASVDTNHAERDKHLREEDFLHVKKYPQARFVGKSWRPAGKVTAKLTGELTLRGVTREIVIDVEQVGTGPDPWGGFRRGFLGKTELTLADFGIDYDLGPQARTMELTLSVEGVRQ
jgi:polyisoprenoid-binding protein YceI